MATLKLSYSVVFLSFLSVLLLVHSQKLQDTADHQGHQGHDNHVNKNVSPQHLSLKDSFLDAKKNIDEKYLDCDPILIKLNKKVEDALKTHDHPTASAGIQQLRNFKPSPQASTDPCKDHPTTTANGASNTLPHDHDHTGTVQGHNHGAILS